VARLKKEQNRSSALLKVFSCMALMVSAKVSLMIIDINGKTISSLLLINSLDNGKIQTVNSMKYHSQKIKQTLGIEFKYHYLRHTFDTRLAEQNMPSHLLCNQMGHASSKVTEKYYIAVSKHGKDIIKDKIEWI